MLVILRAPCSPVHTPRSPNSAAVFHCHGSVLNGDRPQRNTKNFKGFASSTHKTCGRAIPPQLINKHVPGTLHTRTHSGACHQMGPTGFS